MDASPDVFTLMPMFTTLIAVMLLSTPITRPLGLGLLLYL
jgi:hypothetical protein